MSTEAVKINYSKAGVGLIEMLYSDAYLSLGGKASTDRLAQLAGIEQATKLLDVGSGLGGPLLHIVEAYGCQGTGLDLMPHNTDHANAEAAKRGLSDHARFITGDATNLELDDATFEVVMGQDAWCHVPDKPALISECVRVLKPGGIMAFTDWTETGPMSDTERATILEATASNNMTTLTGYCEMIEANGCAITLKEDISQTFTQAYRDIIARMNQREEEITNTFNEKFFQILKQKNTEILDSFEAGQIGGALIVAGKSA